MTNTFPAAAILVLMVAPTFACAADSPPLAKAPFDAKQAKQFQQHWADHIGKPVVYTNSLGMKMVLLPSGEFRQGASNDEIDTITREIQESKGGNDRAKRWSFDHIVPYEGPDRLVRLTRPYRISAHEVTVGQFRKFVEATGYKTDAEREEIDPKSNQTRRTWRKSIFDQTDEHPVLEASWHDAVALCRWLSKKEGRTYRLPTEAEWDFAARAGSSFPARQSRRWPATTAAARAPSAPTSRPGRRRSCARCPAAGPIGANAAPLASPKTTVAMDRETLRKAV
jgi:formylglycine-generating enzyme required for sulfatase activity